MLLNQEYLLEEYRGLHGEPDPQLHFQYSVSYFSKINFRENDIFMVYADISGQKKRIGWLFPVFVLASSEYNLFRDQHFTVYLRVGASYLLTTGRASRLDENTHLLILKDESLVNGDLISENFEISLLKWGYYPTSAGLAISNSLCEIDNSIINKIHVNKCSAICEYDPYIKKLLLELLPNVSDPLSRFISIYQTIEILMEKYFYNKIDHHRAKISTIGTIRDAISEFSSEKKLIGGLFDQCGHRMQISEEEMVLIRRLFENNKEEVYYSRLNLPNFIYDIRNAIVHNYHKYELSTLMKEISERMEIILVELLENKNISQLLIGVINK